VILTVGRWLDRSDTKAWNADYGAAEAADAEAGAAAGSPPGGDDRAWLEELAEQSGVNASAFLSGLNYSETCRLLLRVRNFRSATTAKFGMVYLEDGVRKPVIGACTRRTRSDSGQRLRYLVPHGDPIQLATSIEALLADPVHAKEMGARGQQRAEHEFRFNVFAKSLKKSCATNANPERHGNVRSFFEFGAPVKVRALSEGLARRGHQVTVVTATGAWKSACKRRKRKSAERSPFGWRREKMACNPFIYLHGYDT